MAPHSRGFRISAPGKVPSQTKNQPLQKMNMIKSECAVCGANCIAEIEDGWLECLNCRSVTYLDCSPNARSCGCGRSPDDLPLEAHWDADWSESGAIHEQAICRLRF